MIQSPVAKKVEVEPKVPKCFERFKMEKDTPNLLKPMTLNYISWNIRGLESLNRKQIVKRFLNRCKDKNVVLLKELKLVGFTLENSLRFVWREVIQFATKHERVRGGAAILLSTEWS